MNATYSDSLTFPYVVPVELPMVIESNAVIVEVASNTNDSTNPVADLYQYVTFDNVGELKIERFELVNGSNLVIFNVPLPSKLRIAPKFNDQNLTLSIWEFPMPISRNGSTMEPVVSSTVTPATVAASTSSIQLLASNANRKTASIVNNSTATLYIELGETASSSAYTVALNNGDLYELPIAYTGVISGIWSAANGNALIREFV